MNGAAGATAGGGSGGATWIQRLNGTFSLVDNLMGNAIPLSRFLFSTNITLEVTKTTTKIANCVTVHK